MTTVPELRIRWEWEPAPSVRAPEHRATWARMEISVGDEHVTLVEDRETGSSRRSIYCPMYPLAEWAAYNWWFLRADARPARNLGLRRSDRYDSRSFRRHSLRSAGDGFRWPDLLIIPDGERKHLVWQRDRLPLSDRRPLCFLAGGEATLDAESVEAELAVLISEVLTRLAEQGVTGTPLEEEWSAIGQTDREEAEFCIAAARLGLDPYSEAEPYEGLILQAAGELHGNLLGDFLDAADPVHMHEGLTWIRTATLDLGRAQRPPDALELRHALRNTVLSRNDRVWELGWSQAETVRRTLELADTDTFDPERYFTALPRPIGDRGLRMVGVMAEESGPAAFMNGRGRPQRFTLSRAFWHYLWESDPVFLVTTAYTERQKVERAFAAELLAPADGIRKLLGTDPRDAVPEDLDGIAEHFGVSSMVIEHQVENQLLAA
jgi:hypothetical protein